MIILELFPIKIKFTIETIFILGLAIIFDLAGIVLICFGLDDFEILDTVGVLIFDTWAMHKSLGPISGKRKGVSGKKSKARNIMKRMLGTTVAEAIPYLGALPFWSYNIYMILKEEIEEEEENQRQEEEEMIMQQQEEIDAEYEENYDEK